MSICVRILSWLIAYFLHLHGVPFVIICGLMLIINGDCRCCRRFVDAPGEPQRPCSQCGEIIHSDYDLAEHIFRHEYQQQERELQQQCKICPICQLKFPREMPESDFVAHVNSHFD